MPVRKFRDVAGMEGNTWREPGEKGLSQAIRATWDLAHRTLEPRFPPGVYKHRSIEDAGKQRERWERANFEAYQARQRALRMNAPRLPITDASLLDEESRPYFLWLNDATVGSFKEHLASSDPDERAYWMGALLREANTRDVRLFVEPAEIRALWPRLIRHLGRSRDMWAWLLGLPSPEWPPRSQIRAG